MGFFEEIMQWILNLGSAIFVPIVIFILGLITRMSVKRAFLSAITLGVAFTGMGMIIGFMSDAVAPASEQMALNTGINLPALDLGWTGAASITWAWVYAFVFFAVQIVINIVMLALNWTKTLNVDMWNVWGKALTGYLVYFVSGSLIAGFIVASLQVVLELKIGDMLQRHVEDLTDIPLVTVTHPMNLSTVFMNPVNKLMDKVPMLNKKADTEALRKKIGIFSENSVMGFIIGTGLGFAGAYSISGSLNLGIQVATAMTLFPMVSKLFMQSLSPLADAMSEFMRKRFANREVFIGMDWPVLAGRSEIWVTIILIVPIFIGYSLILPGNTVLPIAGVLNYSIAVGGLVLTGGNLYRMVILGLIFTPIYLYSATYFAPILTDLAHITGAVNVAEGGSITWSTIEAPEMRIFFAEAFNGNVLAIVGSILFLALFYWVYKIMMTEKVPSERYKPIEGNK